MVRRPIVVVAVPRSGSSMLTGLFAAHGCWVGNCGGATVHCPKGTFENMALKRLSSREHGKLVTQAALAEATEDWPAKVASAIREDGYAESSWVTKISAMYWPPWRLLNPMWVFCRRSPECVVASNRKTKMIKENVEESVRWHFWQMNRLKEMDGGYDVDTEAVVNGNYATLKTAIEGCGLEFSEHVTRKFVDKSLWHYTSA